jgi:hypothetical protein
VLAQKEHIQGRVVSSQPEEPTAPRRSTQLTSNLILSNLLVIYWCSTDALHPYSERSCPQSRGPFSNILLNPFNQMMGKQIDWSLTASVQNFFTPLISLATQCYVHRYQVTLVQVCIALRSLMHTARGSQIIILYLIILTSFIHPSLALQAFVEPSPGFSFCNPIQNQQSSFDGGLAPTQGRYLHTEQREHGTNAHRHPCLQWDSKPRPQCSIGRRQFKPQTASLDEKYL